MSTIKTAAGLSTASPRDKSFVRAAVAAILALLVIGAAGLLTPGAPRIRIGEIALHPHLPDIPLFLRQPTVIQIHLLAALGAVALGAVLMSLRKGRRFHRIGGWTWAALMAATAVSSLFIVGLNGDHWSLIHALSGWTIVSLPLAVLAARRHQVKRHRGAMMGLFYGGILLAGVLAFIPGRLMWRLFLG